MLPNLATNVRKTFFVYNCAWVRFKFQKRLSENYRAGARKSALDDWKLADKGQGGRATRVANFNTCRKPGGC